MALKFELRSPCLSGRPARKGTRTNGWIQRYCLGSMLIPHCHASNRVRDYVELEGYCSPNRIGLFPKLLAVGILTTASACASPSLAALDSGTTVSLASTSLKFDEAPTKLQPVATAKPEWIQWGPASDGAGLLFFGVADRLGILESQLF